MGGGVRNTTEHVVHENKLGTHGRQIIQMSSRVCQGHRNDINYEWDRDSPDSGGALEANYNKRIGVVRLVQVHQILG